MSAHLRGYPKTGFSFKNYPRNSVLEKLNVEAPQPFKTGTTIAGVVFKDGVVLGADTRATMGVMVVDDDCQKIHHLADNIFCCGAGMTADIEAIVRIMSSNFKLMQLENSRLPRVRCATRMIKQMLFRYDGNMQACLIIGGVDATGPHLSCVYPHGSSDVLPFATMGSGTHAAMGVLETGFKDNMTLREAKKLVRESIAAGIENDLGSGSTIQLRVIKKDRCPLFKVPHGTLDVDTDRHQLYTYPPGTTEVIDFQRYPIEKDENQGGTPDDSEDEGR